jgi:sedoheptulokinase
MAAGEGTLILGIDIGTTSVKVCLVDSQSKQVVSKQSKDTQANVPSDLGSEGNKQDVPKITSAINSCVSRLPKDQLKQVRDLCLFHIHFLEHSMHIPV